jgi:hypothetical protein
VNRISARSILGYARTCLRLKTYLKNPGDGRRRPQISAAPLLWGFIMGSLLRENSYHAVEWWVRSKARRSLGVGRSFSNDTLSYFTERLSPDRARTALATVCQRAKRNKVFDNQRYIGLALDGSTAGRCSQTGCAFCHPHKNEDQQTICFLHHFVMISVVGADVNLPFDVEPYPEGDSEYTAGQRLLRRAVAKLGPRFADYVVADSKFATAPFLHVAGEVGLKILAPLKANLPELFEAAQKRFQYQSPHRCFDFGKDRVEIWDADDFDPWESLNWTTVRVIRYRQHKPDGTVIEAYWLTDFTVSEASSQSLFQMAKNRWEIENEGFNDGKNRYGMEHLAHHHANSILIGWLLTLLAIVIERLYRLRYLHRGNHPPLRAIELVRLLRLSLAQTPTDSS